MKHSPADIVRHLLINLIQGTLPTANGVWPVHVEYEPDLPDDCITIYTTQSKEEGRFQRTGEQQTLPGFQIRVRSKTHQTGWEKINTVYDTCNLTVYQNTVTIDTSVYLVHAIDMTTAPIPLSNTTVDTPTSKRRIFVFNGFARIIQQS